jgi:energy-coupling factor transport system ATP-binding protein
MTEVVSLTDVSFAYAKGSTGTGVTNLDIGVRHGEVVALIGPSGCGKTTATRLINGLAPHHHEGTLTGTVRVAGRDVADTDLTELAAWVGSVFQNPRSQFFTTDVGSELAFTAENLGRPSNEIAAAVALTAERFDLTLLLDSSLHELSGGQRQKVACGSATAIDPEVVVLDEPTANLDDASVQDLRRAVLRWKASGCAVVVAEHRLGWLEAVADRWLVLADGQVVTQFEGHELVNLDEARRVELGLRAAQVRAHPRVPAQNSGGLVIEGMRRQYRGQSRPALRIDRLEIPLGSIVAITGPNGAGKSTLARGLVGLDRKVRGRVFLDGVELTRRTRLRTGYLVLQEVNHQLFAESVLDELRLSNPMLDSDDAVEILKSLGLADLTDRHPMSLSGGQKQRVAIAGALAAGRKLLVLDEPTSGLDLEHMRQVSALLTDLAAQGATVLIVTHDRELVEATCTHELRLEGGHVATFDTIVRDG